MTKDDVIQRLRAAANEAGSVKLFAANIGLSLSYVSDVLNGYRPPGDRILDALGLERVVTYQEKSSG